MSSLPIFKRIAKNRLLIVLAVVVLLLACAALTLYAFTTTLTGVNDIRTWVRGYNQALNSGELLVELRDADAAEAISMLRGLTLPPSAHDLRFGREGRVQIAYWIRFALPSADLDTFLASTCFTAPLTAVAPTFAYASDDNLHANLDWWTPARAARFVGGECAPDAEVTFRALVDQTDAKQTTVYLEIVTQ